MLNALPDGEDYLRRPVQAGYIPYTALLDGSVDLADIARMNDWIDIKADNDARIDRWERENSEC
ncbi:NTP pyrophosphohydrolase [Enterobacteriaceae bacterium ENNIH3]|nr:NTP pyrophosphohydrolase [Enterobacteriaceae bacterium ENNIH3]AUV09644.1 NTP pyrophosphohydrolase [Enterobacteriaceae bacterium ENNIH2]